jgi:antitoxin component YwqK of YwqJK toxin-antitoxin module
MPKSIKTEPLRFSRIDFYRLREFDFDSALFRSIQRQLGEGKTFDQRWAKLSPLQQGVYAWWVFWGEIENGGFVQYFYNQGDKGVPGLVALLKATGNAPLANLIKKATQIYHKRRADFQTDKVWGKDGLFAKATDLNKLDTSVGGQLDGAGKRIEKWLRANSAKIFVGDDGQPIDPAFTGEIQTKHPSGKVFEQATIRRGAMTGAYRRYLPDGTLDHAEFYEKGKVSGDYWPSGQLKKKKTKQGDQLIIEWFYPSGQLQKRYVRGKSGHPVEPIRLWHENGQLAEELHVKNDKKSGPWLKFFDDGKPKLQARYDNDEQLVVENAWDNERRPIVKNGAGTYLTDDRTIDWEYDLFFENHWVRSLPLHKGKPNGKGRTWHAGVLWGDDTYKNGKKDGVQIGYYDNGRIRTKSTYRGGKELKVERFPKFDKPRPAVLIKVEANSKLYASWKKPLPDAYPQPKYLAKLQAGLPIPQFLQDVYQRNLTKTVTDDYEDINRFNDGASYFLRINEKGEVEKVEFTGCSVYSIAVAETYLPILKQLRFTPARLRGKKVPGWAIVRVEHTFVEGEGK